MREEFVNPFLTPAVAVWEHELGESLHYLGASAVPSKGTTAAIAVVIGDGRGSQHHNITTPRGLGQLGAKDTGRVNLDENDGAKVVAGAQVHEAMVPAGKAVVAGVNTSLVWVNRPAKVHTANPVQDAFAVYLFVLRFGHGPSR